MRTKVFFEPKSEQYEDLSTSLRNVARNKIKLSNETSEHPVKLSKELVELISSDEFISETDLARLIYSLNITESEFEKIAGTKKINLIDSDYSAKAIMAIAEQEKYVDQINEFWRFSTELKEEERKLKEEESKADLYALIKKVEFILIEAALHGQTKHSFVLIPPNDVTFPNTSIIINSSDKVEDTTNIKSYEGFCLSFIEYFNKKGFLENGCLSHCSLNEEFSENFDEISQAINYFEQIKNDPLAFPIQLKNVEESVFRIKESVTQKVVELIELKNKPSSLLTEDNKKYLRGLNYYQLSNLIVYNFNSDIELERPGYHFDKNDDFCYTLLYWLNDVDAQKIIKTIFSELVKAKKNSEQEVTFELFDATYYINTIQEIYDGSQEAVSLIKKIFLGFNIDFGFFSENSFVIFNLEVPLTKRHVIYLFSILGYEVKFKCNNPKKGQHLMTVVFPN